MRIASMACCVTLCVCGELFAEPVRVTVHADEPGRPASRLLTGACIEDVNHEIYGGLYSQMLFGESFQEPAPVSALKGFTAFDGTWMVDGDQLKGSAGDGPRLVAAMEPFADGEAGVDVLFPDAAPGNAGLIVRASNAQSGADSFDGYEVSLDCAAQIVRLGRHRHDWQHFSDTHCEIPVGKWIALKVAMKGDALEVLVDGRQVASFKDSGHALAPGVVGLRQWQRAAAYRNLWATSNGMAVKYPFEKTEESVAEISGMWRGVRRGNAAGAFRLDKEGAFVGAQSQWMEFKEGDGAVGVENQGLNRWGMFFREGANYEGVVWAKADAPVELWASLESADGSKTYAEQMFQVTASDWQRIPFELVSSGNENRGRFALTLKKPGTVTLGYAFLQPGEWGRFKGMPVRRDVAEGLLDEGVTVLRYGGSVVNHGEYRWKNMIGPRDKRPPYHGTWYPYSTNGWGIVDFMDFCEAAGFECIPAFNSFETPQDMADFIEYAKGAADTEWGRRRVEDGHPEPYKLNHIEIGNEERVDEEYAARFAAIARRVWPLDPNMVLVVGDFAYGKPITDPFDISGSAARLKTLKGQQNILALARENNREVWFDVHMGTEGPRPDSSLGATFTFIDALEKLAQGARFHVVVFEFNAGNHSQKRALANALAMNAIQRDGRIPVTCSANCLQPDGQNDNAWDQGLLFLNPSQVWLQPPGWVLRMASRHFAPVDLRTEVAGSEILDACARRSDDGKMLVLQAVNLSDNPADARLFLKGYGVTSGTVEVETLSAPLDAVNTAENPRNVAPVLTQWPFQLEKDEMYHTFAPRSFTVMQFK